MGGVGTLSHSAGKTQVQTQTGERGDRPHHPRRLWLCSSCGCVLAPTVSSLHEFHRRGTSVPCVVEDMLLHMNFMWGRKCSSGGGGTGVRERWSVCVCVWGHELRCPGCGSGMVSLLLPLSLGLCLFCVSILGAGGVVLLVLLC